MPALCRSNRANLAYPGARNSLDHGGLFGIEEHLFDIAYLAGVSKSDMYVLVGDVAI
jgi:hypothetical protein